MKVIYHAISKTLLYNCRDPKKPRVVLFGPTRISLVNIGEIVTHFAHGMEPGSKLLGLNDKSKATLRNKLSEVNFLIIDHLSMASSDLWKNIDLRLEEVFMIIPKTAFYFYY